MTESRDQRFFDELNKTARAEDDESPSAFTTGPQPVEPCPKRMACTARAASE